ncbi:MAG: hypothetical protein WBB28_14415 [Crinalium sp.]
MNHAALAVLVLQQRRNWVEVTAKYGRTQLFEITEQGESAFLACCYEGAMSTTGYAYAVYS